jgi:uncharacterized protein YjbJ (UPF0337 family)
MGTESMKDRVKGKANEAVGAARSRAGDWTDNEKMEAEGEAQRLKGKAQGVQADARDAVDDAKDKAKSAFS